jgi:hypothetical protein
MFDPGIMVKNRCFWRESSDFKSFSEKLKMSIEFFKRQLNFSDVN